MRKILSQFLLASTGLIASSAFADLNPSTSNDFSSHPPADGFYVGGQLGYGGMITPKGTNGVTNTAGEGLIGRSTIGYLNTTGMFQFGPEAGISTYNNNNYENKNTGFSASYKGFDVDLLAVMKANLSNKWHLLGKIGTAYVDQEYTSTASGHIKNHQFYPEIAAGFGYNFSAHLTGNITGSWILGRKPDAIDGTAQPIEVVSKVAPVKTVMAGITYTFAG